MKFYLSIVIPYYNEKQRIGDSLEKIINYLSAKDYQYELILVDDGSTDDTFKIIDDLINALNKYLKNCHIVHLANKTNKGKGYSVRKGVLAAQGTYVLFSDADLSTPIADIEKLTPHLEEGYNIALGSRSLKDSDVTVRQNFIRETMGKSFNLFVRFFTGLKFYDTQCGFKCFDQRAVKEIFPNMKIDGFSFDVEILYLAQKYGLKAKEIPVHWENSKDSKVKIFQDSLSMLISLTKIKKMHSEGKDIKN